MNKTKIYKRVENRSPGSKLITFVDEDGVYEQYTRWEDGTICGYFKTTLKEMGWNSLYEFLHCKKGFNVIN